MSNIRVKISTAEKALADGRLYSVTHTYTGVGIGANVDFLFTTHATNIATLIGIIVEGTGDGTITLYENGTDTGGTGITPLDLNRVTANTADTTVAHTQSNPATGTLIGTLGFIAGTKNSAIPFQFEGQAALVMAAAEDYGIRINNGSGNAGITYTIRAVFTETT